MNKVLLELRIDGVYDSKGMYIGGGHNTILDSFPYEDPTIKKEKSLSIQDIIKLKEAGFSSEEITDLRNKEVI